MDRLQWIDLNLGTFQRLIGRLEAELTGSRPTPRGAGPALARIVNRSIGNHQLGWLLAFLATKVLGQYDISLLATATPPRGRLYFVEANVVATADSLGIGRDTFRTFIAIHEVTHAYEFEAHPWLRRPLRGTGGGHAPPARGRRRWDVVSAGPGPRRRQATGWSGS